MMKTYSNPGYNPRPHLGKMLSLEQAAKLVGFNQKTIRSWISNGTLTWYKYDESYVVHYRDLLRAQWEQTKDKKHSRAHR